MTSRLCIKESEIKDAGIGLFSNIFIPKGTIVMIFSLDSFIISKREYNEQQKKGNELMMNTGCRLAGEIFLYTDSRMRFENYVNHSFSPNLLYHAGLCIAKEDIPEQTELTLDYQYILSEDDDMGFVDTVTNKQVKGYTGTIALKKSAQELLNIIDSGTQIK